VGGDYEDAGAHHRAHDKHGCVSKPKDAQQRAGFRSGRATRVWLASSHRAGRRSLILPATEAVMASEYPPPCNQSTLVRSRGKPGILWAMIMMRNHEKMKDLWPPKFEMPHGFWDTYHPGGEWGILYQVKWIEPNRKGELPFVKVIVRWNDVDFRTVFSSDDTVFLKGLYETLCTGGVGHSLE